VRLPRAGFGSFVAALALAGALSAQEVAAHPAGTRVSVADDSLTSDFEVSGVKVILRRSTANEVVVANLYLIGGDQLFTPQTIGIEPLLLWTSERGTKKYTRDVLRRKMAALGSSIVVEPQDDWTMFGFRGVRAAFDSTWVIFADRLTAASLDSTQVEQVRAQVLSAVRQRRDSPDDLVQEVADSMTFAGHPYSLPASGNERSLSRFTVADLRRYRDTAIVTSRMLLVVVGNVQRDQLERLVASTIGKQPHGNFKWTPPTDPGTRTPAVDLLGRPLPTNYILGYYIGPPSTSPDYQALRVATAVLGGRLFTEIRSRRNLTYDVSAPFVERAISSGGLYVTTVYPDTTLALMKREIGDLQGGLVDEDNLEAIVQQFITEYFLNNETNAAQANFLARAQIYRGDYHLASNFVDELRRVSPNDVRAAARKYIRGVRFAYAGDTTRVSKAALLGF